VEQLVGYSVMTEVDILMISGLLVNTVPRDILEPCHGDSDKLIMPTICCTDDKREPSVVKRCQHWIDLLRHSALRRQQLQLQLQRHRDDDNDYISRRDVSTVDGDW